MTSILITGAAGFIGYHLALRLLDDGHRVVGVDNLDAYYDVDLKRARLAQLQGRPGFVFEQLDLVDRDHARHLFANCAADYLVHLAAQPGVRYSIENPAAYIDNNLVAFGNVLEGARAMKSAGHLRHFVFASSSSVYGANERLPFSESDPVDHPVSLYAATKKANELMAHAYAHLFGIPVTGLRFFTVYGPWGRPDMAIFKFTRAIIGGDTIQVFNHGQLIRDYTYVGDVVEGVVRVLARPAQPDPTWQPAAPDAGNSAAPYRIYNIGNHQPVQLMDFIHAIEAAVRRKAVIEFLPMQPGDVRATEADVSRLTAAIDFQPATPMAEGVARFVAWYREFYGLAA